MTVSRAQAGLLASATAAALISFPAVLRADEPAICRSTNPADWPAASKPYFLIAFDTSGSMQSGTAANSCKTANGYSSNYPDNRSGTARCAVTNTIRAFSGLVNFGLMAFPRTYSGSSGPTTCETNINGGGGCSLTGSQCGSGSDASREGGNLLVALQQDNYWDPPGSQTPSNVPDMLAYVDNNCSDCRELWADGSTPLNGILRDAKRYLEGEYNWPGTGSTGPFVATPLTGTERPCRSVNVILMTDGDDTCDGQTQTEAAAASLLSGVTVAGNTWNVQTHVIAMANNLSDADGIAAAGGTGTAYIAENEPELAAALSTIISGAIPPEVCNNLDDNCNGCTDEGSKTYCNRNKTPSTNPTGPGQCCSAARATCISNFQASIDPINNPQGDQWWLPCWDPTSGGGFTDPETKWLCNNPGEVCDDLDQNCDVEIDPGDAAFSSNVADEGFDKCPDCPEPETCDGTDENCDGVIDNDPSTPGSPFSLPMCTQCVPSPEICDGCDNDCDGDIDEGLAAIDCGFSPPAFCAGQRTCTAQLGGPGNPGDPGYVPYLDQQGQARGTCPGGAGSNSYGACNAAGGGPETCDGEDDDCNGIVDDGIPPTPCDAPGAGAGTVYQSTFADSQCVRGQQPCNGSCSGGIGPSNELCNGVDNNCDGVIDGVKVTPEVSCNQDTDCGTGQICLPNLGNPNNKVCANPPPGTGNECGSAIGQCQKGQTACIGGQLVCAGGTPQSPEVCDGLDNDCNGFTDDAPLGDAPSDNKCWNITGQSCNPQCSHTGATGTFEWCPPAGATCTGAGSLTAPCQVGTLICDGASGWRCQGGTVPGPEVCDGADNDCNGQQDENLGSPIGDQCGSDEGECEFGTNACNNGSIVCQGGNNGSSEVCDGVDNDCDGTIDNGIGLGNPCDMPFDTNDYPVPPQRDQGECRKGNLQCDGMGATECVGGVGPSAEVCDGKDNDCDGLVDEEGAPPDGINGTADPNDPSKVIGAECGDDTGECEKGNYACQAGQVVCAGFVGPADEVCDCADNDCDGEIDEDAMAGEDPLCSTGKDCVELGSGVCQCAEPCRNNEFPCPVSGTECENVTKSGTAETGDYCVNDPCGDCTQKSGFDAQGNLACEPAGGTNNLPVCECKGDFGCRGPCFNQMCPDGQACATKGSQAGQCVEEGNCFVFGCPDGEACNATGDCVTNPCDPNPCQAGEACKPNSTFTEARCVGSCADVTCDAGKECVEGECQDTGCGQDCPSGEVCKPSGDAGFACGPSECMADSCPSGAYCDPATGTCGRQPCSGVQCPEAQECVAGECQWAPEGGAGTGGAAGGAGMAGGAGTAGSGGAGGNTDGGAAAGGTGATGPEEDERGVWGLATGGGGCACRAGGERTPMEPFAIGFTLVGLIGAVARRRRRNAGKEAA